MQLMLALHAMVLILAVKMLVVYVVVMVGLAAQKT
jgi:hypothetical protein